MEASTKERALWFRKVTYYCYNRIHSWRLRGAAASGRQRRAMHTKFWWQVSLG